MALTQVKAEGLAADVIDETKLADNSIDSEHYNDGSIDAEHILDAQIVEAKLATGAVTTTKLASGAVGTTAIAVDTIDETRLKVSNSPTNGQFLSAQSGNTGGLTWAAVPAGVGGATGVDFNDDVKARWGTGNDLEVFHDASDSRINNTTGRLKLKSNGYTFYDSAGNDILAIFNNDAACELYHDNVKKFETLSSGATISGELLVQGGEGETGNLNLWADEGDDNADKWRVKADTAASGLYIQNYASGSWEETIKAHGNGAVELYHDNAKKFNTASDGATVTGSLFCSEALQLNDSKKIQLGTSQDLELYHDGSHSRIKNTTGYLILQSSTGILLKNDTDDENFIVANDDGSVELCHNGTKMLETTADGVTISNGSLYMGDYSSGDGYVALGASQDLQVYHDGSNSYVKNTTGDLYLTTTTDGDDVYLISGSEIRILTDNSNESSIICTSNAGVELYYNDSKKLETTSAGGTLTGTWTGAGKILQVKKANLGSDLNTGSTSWTDVGLSETITLASTSNYIYIVLSTTPYIGGGSEERFRLIITVTPSGGSSTTVLEDNYWCYRTGDDWKASSGHHDVYYHPNSTAELTINVQTQRQTGGDNIWLGRHATDMNTNTLTVMEVGA